MPKIIQNIAETIFLPQPLSANSPKIKPAIKKPIINPPVGPNKYNNPPP